MALDTIPKQLVCVTIGPGDNIQVPLPIRSVSFPLENSSESEKLIKNNKFLIATHPESNIGVLGNIVNAKNDGYSWILDFELLFRVLILEKSKNEDGELIAEWVIFEEKLPTPEEFAAKALQERIIELRRLMLKFFLLLREEDPAQSERVIPFPKNISSNTLGMWVDRSADVLNYFSDREEILGFLLKILEEADVKKRLEKTIDFYNYCLKNAEELRDKDFLELKNSLTNETTTATETPEEKKKEKVLARDELVQKLIFRSGLKSGKTGKKVAEKDKKGGSDKDAPERDDLVKRLIFRIRGKEEK